MPAKSILAREVDSMTLQDVEELGQHLIVFDIQDISNMTEQRWEKLRYLASQRNEETGNSGISADELTARLSQVQSRPSPTPTDNTESTASGISEEKINHIYQIYEELRAMGGRPSAPIASDPGPCPSSKSDVDKLYHISDHWNSEWLRVDSELARWRNFRKHQQDVRSSLASFNSYSDNISQYAQRLGIKWVIKLQREAEQQTKLDEWKEYFIYESRRQCHLAEKVDSILKMSEAEQSYRYLTLTKARKELRELQPLMLWIKAQIPAINAECASSYQVVGSPDLHVFQAKQPSQSPGSAIAQRGAAKKRISHPVHRRVTRSTVAEKKHPTQAVKVQKARITKSSRLAKFIHHAKVATRRSTRIRRQPVRFQ